MVTRFMEGAADVQLRGLSPAILVQGTARHSAGTSQELSVAARHDVVETRRVEMLAYFDPGSGSMLVQVLVGGAAGLAVFARYLWDHFGVGALLRRRKAAETTAAR